MRLTCIAFSFALLLATLVQIGHGHVYYQASTLDPLALGGLRLRTACPLPSEAFAVSVWAAPDMSHLQPDPTTQLLSLPTWSAAIWGTDAGSTQLFWQPAAASAADGSTAHRASTDDRAGVLGLQLGLQFISANVTLPSGAWNHIVATFDFRRGVAELWLNGTRLPLTQEFLKTRDSLPPPNATLVIGNWDAALESNNSFPGAIDDVAVWDVRLSEDEIGRLWLDARPDQLNRSPLAFFAFDDAPLGPIHTDITDVSLAKRNIIAEANSHAGVIISDQQAQMTSVKPYGDVQPLSNNEVCLMKKLNFNVGFMQQFDAATVLLQLAGPLSDDLSRRVDTMSAVFNETMQNDMLSLAQKEAAMEDTLRLAVNQINQLAAEVQKSIADGAAAAQQTEAQSQSMIVAAFEHVVDFERNRTAEFDNGMSALNATVHSELVSLRSEVAAGELRTRHSVDVEMHAMNDTLAAQYGRTASRIETVESSLLSNLANESVRAMSREDALAEAVAAERQRATVAEASLGQQIQHEAQRATEAENTISSAVDAEQHRAAAAELALNSTVYSMFSSVTSLVHRESIRHAEAEAMLAQRIANLTTDLAREAFTRASEVAALSERLRVLESRVPHCVFAGLARPFSVPRGQSTVLIPWDNLFLQHPDGTGSQGAGVASPSVVFNAALFAASIHEGGIYRLEANLRVIKSTSRKPMPVVAAWVKRGSDTPLGPSVSVAGAGNEADEFGDASVLSALVHAVGASSEHPYQVQVKLFGVSDNDKFVVTKASTMSVTQLG